MPTETQATTVSYLGLLHETESQLATLDERNDSAEHAFKVLAMPRHSYLLRYLPGSHREELGRRLLRVRKQKRSAYLSDYDAVIEPFIPANLRDKCYLPEAA